MIKVLSTDAKKKLGEILLACDELLKTIEHLPKNGASISGILQDYPTHDRFKTFLESLFPLQELLKPFEPRIMDYPDSDLFIDDGLFIDNHHEIAGIAFLKRSLWVLIETYGLRPTRIDDFAPGQSFVDHLISDDQKSYRAWRFRPNDNVVGPPFPVLQTQRVENFEEAVRFLKESQSTGGENAIAADEADTQTDTSAKNKNVENLVWDIEAKKCAEAFKQDRDEGSLSDREGFCVRYKDKHNTSATGSTLNKKLQNHRNEWDPDKKYGRPKASNG